MEKNLSELLNKPLAVGNRTIEKRLILAPMTQLGHVAYREMLADYGGYGLLFSEMCSATRIPHENRWISPYFNWRDAERPYLACQIVGAAPAAMAEAATRIEAEGMFGVDINFGCSVSAICRTHAGAAALKDPDRATEMISAVRQAVSVPVTVKFRTGWTDDPMTAVDMARRFEDAGADALTFHPRVAPDRRSRPPRWEHIARVKAAVSIPVFGNGDVFSPEDCLRMLETTGCDGVAVGRMAIAKPWLFAQWTDGFQPQPGIYRHTAFRLMSLITQHFDPPRALARIKKFTFYFSANFRFGHTLFSSVQNAPDMTAVADAFSKFFEHPPELTIRPNRHYLS